MRDLVNLFGSIKSIKDGEGRSYLVLKLPYPSTEYHAGVQAGTDFVAKLNAIAQVRCGDHENVKIGATGYVNPESGLLCQHIAVQGFRIELAFTPSPFRRAIQVNVRPLRSETSLSWPPAGTSILIERSICSVRYHRIGAVCTWCLKRPRIRTAARVD